MRSTRLGPAALALAVITSAFPGIATSSSHREAPGIAQRPAGDNTDVYFFVSPEDPDRVVLVSCFWPLEEPAGGPNYYNFDEAMDYNFHIDNDGDSREDIRFVFRFSRRFNNPGTALYATGEISSLTDPDWNYRQLYDLVRIDDEQGPGVTIGDDLPCPPANIGPRTTPDYDGLAAQAVRSLDNGIKVFAGQRDDPFFVDLGAVFDLLGFRAIPGNVGQGVDGLGGYNCQALVLEVPIALLTRNGANPSDPADPAAVLGLWSTASAPTAVFASPSTPKRQISRLGMPLVNEVVIPIGRKDEWNYSRPEDDGQFLSYVTDPELAHLIQALYGIPAPPTPRCDLVSVFLTGIPGLNQPPNVVPAEEMRLNVAIKPDQESDSRFGLLGGDLDGFPNGRRLADDIVDIEERVVEGVVYPLLCDANYQPHALAGQLGDGIDANDRPFLGQFPYLATPHEGWGHEHHRVEAPHGPQVTTPPKDMAARTQTREASIDDRPAVFEMGASSPNPTGGASRISFRLARSGAVRLSVFDVAGREVRSLVSGSLEAGPHEVAWDGSDEGGRQVPAGVYLYRLTAEGRTADRKVAMLSR